MASLNDITEDPFMGYNEEPTKPNVLRLSEEDIYGSFDQVVPTRDITKQKLSYQGSSNSIDEVLLVN